MSSERFDLFVLAQAHDDLVRPAEGIVDLRETLDQACAALEERCELADRQVPR
jgi:hypothetical protein